MQTENTIELWLDIALSCTTPHVVFSNIKNVFDFQMSQHALINLGSYKPTCRRSSLDESLWTSVLWFKSREKFCSC